MPPLNTTMWTYPWDLHDEGYESVLHKLRKEVGLNAINLASAYHTFDMLRPHLPANNTLQVSQAAIYFQPQESSYGTIKPHVSPLMQNENWWGEAVKAASSAGINLNSWTVFFHNSYQAQAHPECAEVRCTGDISTSALCPANPEVRAFAIALSQDLVQNYGISLLECELLAYSGWGHLHHHAKHGINLGRGGRYLFSLCFCDACKKRAVESNIDIAQLQQSVTQKIQTAFTTGQPIGETPRELNNSIPELQALSNMRETVVTSLVRELKDAIDVPLSYILMGDPQITGANPEVIAQIANSVEILSYTSDPQRTQARVSELLPILQSPDQLIVGLQAYPPASPNADTLFANLQAAKEKGIHKFAFYNYGIMPLDALDWVAQAIERGNST
ncbi:MAG: hypothetical protein QGG64_11215 [Candidatus Latescibacteria bacterium]|nr:hypothetical protein [Candidatus Latescibacterota bacterium]